MGIGKPAPLCEHKKRRTWGGWPPTEIARALAWVWVWVEQMVSQPPTLKAEEKVKRTVGGGHQPPGSVVCPSSRAQKGFSSRIIPSRTVSRGLFPPSVNACE